MKDLKSLRQGIGETSSRFLWGDRASVRLADLLGGTILGGRRPQLVGKSILIKTHEQVIAAAALIELDGIAGRLVLCPPDLPAGHLASVVADAGVDAIVTDHDLPDVGVDLRVICGVDMMPAGALPSDPTPSEWVLLTSGTSGAPKLVLHSLRGLSGAIARAKPSSSQDVVWSTFYDIRRYGGLQIFLRGLFSGGSLILSNANEPLGDFLVRLGRRGVTHISGTPSHWRRVLMSPRAHAMAPRYIRLSGEIADQAVLDNLKACYPDAGIGHAYASTEAGVAFEVNDGREGFPANLLGTQGDVEMKVFEGSLRIRSSRTATRYIDRNGSALLDEDGFVDTGDMIEMRNGRCYFLGRRTGIINVGGLKVHPEEVEAVINRHPQVRMSRVCSRKNPISGAVVVADVVLKDPVNEVGAEEAQFKREIFQICRRDLALHKVPVMVRFVPQLDLAAAGKISRHA